MVCRWRCHIVNFIHDTVCLQRKKANQSQGWDAKRMVPRGQHSPPAAPDWPDRTLACMEYCEAPKPLVRPAAWSMSCR